MDLIRELSGIQQEDWRRNEGQVKIAEAKRMLEKTLQFIGANYEEIERYCVDHGKDVKKLREVRINLTASHLILDQLSK